MGRGVCGRRVLAYFDQEGQEMERRIESEAGQLEGAFILTNS
jgi:hypothetical protein